MNMKPRPLTKSPLRPIHKAYELDPFRPWVNDGQIANSSFLLSYSLDFDFLLYLAYFRNPSTCESSGL